MKNISNEAGGRILAGLLTLSTMGAVALALTGCPNEPKDDKKTEIPEIPQDPVKQQGPETITLHIDISRPDLAQTATVEGNLTDAQWAGLPNRIQTAILAGYAASPNIMFKDTFGAIFNVAEDAKIIVEKTSAYQKWNITGDTNSFYTVKLNYDYINSLDDAALANAMHDMAVYTKYPDLANAKAKVKSNNVIFANASNGYVKMNKQFITQRNYAVHSEVTVTQKA